MDVAVVMGSSDAVRFGSCQGLSIAPATTPLLRARTFLPAHARCKLEKPQSSLEVEGELCLAAGESGDIPAIGGRGLTRRSEPAIRAAKPPRT